MRTLKQRLQGTALFLRCIPGVSALYLLWYALAQRAFLYIASRSAYRAGDSGIVRSIYLRRSGGHGELVPGASDLDFFLVLSALPAEREMGFLKIFWRSYDRLRLLFPFLGEVLMGEESELRQWLETPTVRSFEAAWSWKLLSGQEMRGLPSTEPELRDSYSEALKCYWAQLQPVLKLREQQFHAGLRSWESGSVHLRHSAKAALDIFRLHHVASLGNSAERQRFWRATRLELTEILPTSYGELAALRPLLLLEGALFRKEEPFELFSGLLHTSALCLDDLACTLRDTHIPEGEAGWSVLPEAAEPTSSVDRYSLSVRELFAERMLLRHAHCLTRAVLSEANTHLFFLFAGRPSLDSFRELLRDLRDVSFSFDRFSVAMPLTEAAFRELERSSVFDTPFHAYCAHRESRLAEDGSPHTGAYVPAQAFLPAGLLNKTFAELSFVLRFPPLEVDYFLERMVGLVLGLRVASEQKEIAASFHSAWKQYRLRFPERSVQLEQRLAPYLYAPSAGETEAWEEIFESLARFDEVEPGQGRRLRAQLESLRSRNRLQASSPTLATDLWITLTPFLRMEMAALKEKHFHHRGQMKV